MDKPKRMCAADLIALLLPVALVAGLSSRYVLCLANAVRRGEIPESELDDVDVWGV